ncbi:reticulon-4-interacting protein 1, mitochondrial precursor [Jackrogersella minutella]|nr:reticulon-4-interacting protein 1, mitochondrial precursor [Jackrogersella minutella]
MATTSSADHAAMRAWVYTTTNGGLEKNIKLVDDTSLPLRQPVAKDAILVKVHYSSLNPVDYKLPELGFLARFAIPTPASPGLDFSGVVAEKGDEVDACRVGDKVYGRIDPTKYGTLGEYIGARMDGCSVLPEGVSLEDASCIGTAGLTAFQCIVPNAKKGDRVFINGGSGGTGTFGIQIAKALSCHVTTSCSGKNVELCRSLGADEVIDYTKNNVSEILKTKGQVYQLVVDNVGAPADLYKAADHFLLPNGKFVQVGIQMSPGSIASTASRQLLPSFLGGGKRSWEYLLTKNNHEHLDQLGTWMKEGKVKAVIDETFQYNDVPKAFAKLKLGHARGKIVVRGPA